MTSPRANGPWEIPLIRQTVAPAHGLPENTWQNNSPFWGGDLPPLTPGLVAFIFVPP